MDAVDSLRCIDSEWHGKPLKRPAVIHFPKRVLDKWRNASLSYHRD